VDSFCKKHIVLIQEGFKILRPDYRPPPLLKEELIAKRVCPKIIHTYACKSSYLIDNIIQLNKRSFMNACRLFIITGLAVAVLGMAYRILS